MTDFSKLTRERHPIPAFVRVALSKKDLWDEFHGRPAYQQNDYVGWIIRAKRAETRSKRISQMLDELESGNVYMKMHWNNPNGRKV
jgi:uncharacterized protein YdeI (YjbR/CyaY-like superfamily)